MAKLSKKNTAVLIIVISVAALVSVKYLVEGSRGGFAKGQPARSKGNPRAAVQIIEYIDFQCPACANGVKYLHEQMTLYPDKIYVDVKYFPLGTHRHAFVAARYGECAARQQKFWPFLELLLAQQKEWIQQADASANFLSFAQQSQVDTQGLQACLQDPKIDEVILKDRNEGNRLGVRSTPTYFINGKMVVGTNSLADELRSLLGPKIK